MFVTDEQKKQMFGILINGAISIVIALVAVFGYDITVKPIHQDDFPVVAFEPQAVSTDVGTVGDLVSKSKGGLFQGNVQFEDFFGAQEVVRITVSEGGTITPTGTYQPITSTAAITTSISAAIADGTTIGDLLWLVNESANDMIIDDAANTNLSGDTTLGNGDTLLLMWDGADWLELGQADN